MTFNSLLFSRTAHNSAKEFTHLLIIQRAILTYGQHEILFMLSSRSSQLATKQE